MQGNGTHASSSRKYAGSPVGNLEDDPEGIEREILCGVSGVGLESRQKPWRKISR